jgi:cytochrome P450
MIARLSTAVRRRFFPGPAPALLRADNADLEAPDALADPFSFYETLRREGPVLYLPRNGLWLVLGEEAVSEAFEAPHIFSNAPYAPIDAVLLGADPPDHAAVRRLLAPCFSATAMRRLEEVADAAAKSLIAPRIDAVSGFAAPITRALAADLLGLSPSQVEAIQAAAAQTASRPDALPAYIARLDAIAGTATLIETLRRDAQGSLGEAELRSLARLLWLAATTTTERVIAWSILHLLRDSDLRARVTADRALLPALVEEVMRLHPPEHLLPRRTTAPASLAGVPIPAGAEVRLAVAAANRDPAGREDPAALRLDRVPGPQWAFGGGVHRCPGARLARRVVPRVVDLLLDAMPDFQALEPLDRLEWFATSTALAPRRLLVGADAVSISP